MHFYKRHDNKCIAEKTGPSDDFTRPHGRLDQLTLALATPSLPCHCLNGLFYYLVLIPQPSFSPAIPQIIPLSPCNKSSTLNCCNGRDGAFEEHSLCLCESQRNLDARGVARTFPLEGHGKS